MAEDHGITIVIYEFPWAEGQRSELDSSVIEHYAEVIKEVAAPFENVRFVSHAYYWPHPNFADPLHVNEIGSQKLSALAAEWYLSLR